MMIFPRMAMGVQLRSIRRAELAYLATWDIKPAFEHKRDVKPQNIGPAQAWAASSGPALAVALPTALPSYPSPSTNIWMMILD